MSDPATDRLDGATVLARSLRHHGVRFMFGIVGFPVVPIAVAAQREGITFVGMRNEQAASYAAEAASYLTGRPQACLVVSGPGVIHALAGLANAQQNLWPMLLIGGASGTGQNGLGAFQEERQVALAAPFCKYAHGVEQVERIPFYVEQALRTSLYGRPGPAYLDLPEDVIIGTCAAGAVAERPALADPPRPQADPATVDAALAAIASAERPLVIVGKGMAWSRAEAEVRAFLEATQLPFLASPMGKGVVPDDHPLSVGAARSHALQHADLIVLLGARLNWIMHFGLPPRFAPNVRVVQVDLAAEQISHNVSAEVALVGDGRAVVAQLNAALAGRPWRFPAGTPWSDAIAEKIAANQRTVAAQMDDDAVPMNYYRVFKDIREATPADAIIVSEGANTMDIGRTQLPNVHPRSRLDAGSYGTMGVGPGFAVAAAVVHPDRKVVCVEGDSAFGFSGMELETACRYGLPITFVVLNNGGIGRGAPPRTPGRPPAPFALSHDARYEKVAEAFGGIGYFVERPEDLRPTLDKALSADVPTVVNVKIAGSADRKPQEFAWKT